LNGPGKRIGERGFLSPGAGCLDGSLIKDLDRRRNSGGICAVDIDGKCVAAVGDFRGRQGLRVCSGDGKDAFSDDFEGAARFEVCDGGEIEG